MPRTSWDDQERPLLVDLAAGLELGHDWQPRAAWAEAHGLDHDELLTADIRRLSVFGSNQVDHGTAVAGIVVGSDNGVGTIGIVPNAGFELITADRGLGPPGNLAAAIGIAAARLGAGDVLLLEAALPFRPGNNPDVLLEFRRSEQVAIGIATSRGITVF